MLKHTILVIGAGKIGTTVAGLLSNTDDYKVFLGDLNKPNNLPNIKNNPIEFVQTDIEAHEEIKNFIKNNNVEAIISCLPFHLTLKVAKIAHDCNIHYFDPTEDVAITEQVTMLAQNSKGVFAPQCGLAPGFISIAANSLMEDMGDIEHVKMRVGALSQSTSNSLHYAFTWSIDSVINEYINPCEVIENGKKHITPALGGLEKLIINDNHFEAFHTSGGVGSLADTYKGKVKNLDYKTIRYPGHCKKMAFLLQDLKLKNDPELVKNIISKVVPYIEQDKVVVYVSVEGYKNGKLYENIYSNTLYPINIGEQNYTAIQMTTASGICTVVDMVIKENKLKNNDGIIKQEQISLKDFLANRFGSYYAQGENNAFIK